MQVVEPDTLALPGLAFVATALLRRRRERPFAGWRREPGLTNQRT
jgi:hypothetical protein